MIETIAVKVDNFWSLLSTSEVSVLEYIIDILQSLACFLIYITCFVITWDLLFSF